MAKKTLGAALKEITGLAVTKSDSRVQSKHYGETTTRIRMRYGNKFYAQMATDINLPDPVSVPLHTLPASNVTSTS